MGTQGYKIYLDGSETSVEEFGVNLASEMDGSRLRS